jgi:ketosteroid isomerase-like protein
VEVLEDGKLALSRGPYKYTEVNAEGDVVDYYGTFNSIWRLQDDGSWKIVFDAGSLAAGKLPEDQLVLLEAEDDCDP